MSPRQPAYELVEVWTTAEATPQPPHRRHDYNNWSVRGEVMFVNFGSQSITISGFPDFGAPGTFTTVFRNSLTLGRVAFSYRW
jgi:hypothetical protein